MASLHIPIVERSIMVSVYRVLGVAMVVLRKDKRRYIFLTLLPQKKGRQVAQSVPKDDAPTKWRFYALQTKGEKSDDGDDDEGNSLHISISNVGSFNVGSVVSRWDRMI